MENFIKHFLKESSQISSNLDVKNIALFINKIMKCKKNKGRIFFLVLVEVQETPHMQLMILEK